MGYVDAGYAVALAVVATYGVLLGTRRSRLERRAAAIGRPTDGGTRTDGAGRAGD